MLNFELPLVRGNIAVHDAYPEIIDFRSSLGLPASGLLYEAGAEDLRLMHFNDLLSIQDDSVLIQEVKFEPVADLMLMPEAGRLSHLYSLGRKFGLLGEGPNGASLFSVAETFGLPYTNASGGQRCSRANRPPAVPARKWYHYYPPLALDPFAPNKCKICGYSIP